MKTKKHSNTIALIIGIAAGTAAAIAALVGMVLADTPIEMNWLPLAGLMVGAVAITGFIARFFNSIDDAE